MSRKKRINPRKRQHRKKAATPTFVDQASMSRTFKVTLETTPAGIVGSNAKPGEKFSVIYQHFTSTEDGDIFADRCRGFVGNLMGAIQKQHGVFISPCTVHGLVAVIESNKTATVHINPPMRAHAQTRLHKAYTAGDRMTKNDLVGIENVNFGDIDIPSTSGVIVLFSIDWYRGLFFDFGPLPPINHKREYDLEEVIGGFYSYLLFKERFNLAEDAWEHLFSSNWFPFMGLSPNTIGELIRLNKCRGDVDTLIPKAREELINLLPQAFNAWSKSEIFKGHMEFLQTAFKHYQNEDYLSCTSVLFPRIEGLLRSFQSLMGTFSNATQRGLSDTVVSPDVSMMSLQANPLLPKKFRDYLSNYYFANFSPEETPLSRNSVGHGTSTAESHDLKGATLGFLIMCQLGYCFANIGKKNEKD